MPGYSLMGDGSPSLAYTTELAANLQLDIMNRGGLDIEDSLLEEVKSKKKDFLKFFCSHAIRRSSH